MRSIQSERCHLLTGYRKKYEQKLGGRKKLDQLYEILGSNLFHQLEKKDIYDKNSTDIIGEIVQFCGLLGREQIL